jgi:hypothetical protein
MVERLDNNGKINWTKKNKEIFMEFFGLTQEYEFEYVIKPLSPYSISGETCMIISNDRDYIKNEISSDNIFRIDQERQRRIERIWSGWLEEHRKLDYQLHQEKINELETTINQSKRKIKELIETGVQYRELK